MRHRLLERADERAPAERNLIVVGAPSARARHRGLRGAFETLARCRRAGENAFGLHASATEPLRRRQARFALRGSSHRERRAATAAEAKAKSYCARSRTFTYVERDAKGRSGSETPTISSCGCERGLDVWRVAGQTVEIVQRDIAIASGPVTWTVASRAASATARSDGATAMHCGRSCRVPRGGGSRRRARRSRSPDPACCTASRRRESTRSACAASSCHRSSPCCAAAAKRSLPRRWRPAESRGRAARRRPRRSGAPARRCRVSRPRASIARSASGLMSTSSGGVFDVDLHQVEHVRAAGDVPRAGFVSDRGERRRRASPREGSRRGSSLAPHLEDRVDDVRIAAAATDVSAHRFLHGARSAATPSASSATADTICPGVQ